MIIFPYHLSANFSTKVPTRYGPQTGQECSIFQGYLLSVQKEVHKWAKHPWCTVYGHENLHQNWCLLQFSWKCDGFESKYCSPLIVLAEIASAKVLIFVLALAVALAVASATKNWDLYWSCKTVLTIVTPSIVRMKTLSSKQFKFESLNIFICF